MSSFSRKNVYGGETDLHTTFKFPVPEMFYSGNGVQSIWLTDLPVDAGTDKLVETFLRVLGKYSIKGKAKVDIGVFIRNQHAKLPGTYSRKGSDTPERPHRMAQRLETLGGLVADTNPFLHAEMLQQVVAANEAYLDSVYNHQGSLLSDQRGQSGRFRSADEAKDFIEGFFDTFGLKIVKKETRHGETEIWRLDRCLYQEDRENVNHKGNPESRAFIQIWVRGEFEGMTGAGCQRTDCKAYIKGTTQRHGIGAWKYMRRLADEEYAAKADSVPSPPQGNARYVTPWMNEMDF